MGGESGVNDAGRRAAFLAKTYSPSSGHELVLSPGTYPPSCGHELALSPGPGLPDHRLSLVCPESQPGRVASASPSRLPESEAEAAAALEGDLPSEPFVDAAELRIDSGLDEAGRSVDLETLVALAVRITCRVSLARSK